MKADLDKLCYLASVGKAWWAIQGSVLISKPDSSVVASKLGMKNPPCPPSFPTGQGFAAAPKSTGGWGLPQGRGLGRLVARAAPPPPPGPQCSGAAELSSLSVGAVQPQCWSWQPPARAAPPPRLVPALRSCPPAPQPAPPRPASAGPPLLTGVSRSSGCPPGALIGAAGPGVRDPPRRAAAPDGCRRGGRAWMRREPEASSSRRRLCPRAPYGLKVSKGRMERQGTQV
jgi:hypothetical protein